MAGLALASAVSQDAEAALGFNVETSGWPSAAHRQAAVDAMQSAVNRYNAYGDFGNYNIYVYYNAGIPTAQANYLGSVGFGGTYPNERVMMHEVAHYLGSGTYGTPWDGPRGEGLIDQFEGLEASFNGDGAHFWPYGLNFDSEGAEINKQRHVAMLYAQRADMGIGSTAVAGSTGAVTMTASDPAGESGFSYASRWSDTHFAHAGATYSTGDFVMRTPASGNCFTFVGDSLRVNNTNGASGGLHYGGTGTTGVTSFKNLIVDGGYVRHVRTTADVFRLAGNMTLVGSATIDAAQGGVIVSANIGGTGSLVKAGPHPLVLTGSNTYAGDTTISAGILRLSPAAAVADYSFDNVSGASVVNGGSGGTVMNGTLANGAAIVGGGRVGNAVSLAGGASVDINHPIADLGNNASWTISAWVKTTTAGASILTKGNGGWANGNTVFYLGDGTAGGSGGIPSGVRWAGGFLQGSTGAPAVNDGTWHQVTYVNGNGAYAIYVDGVAIPLSPGNAGFANADVSSIVRLGVSTNTFAGDGTVNFNGLLDGVQVYSQALSAAQVSALFQGRSIGPLPATTNVSVANGARLDVNGTVQQIASASGPTGSAVSLGNGQLIISNAAGNTTFAGTLSGAGGSLVKAGNSTLTLTAANTHTGGTTVDGGTLVLAHANAINAGQALAVNAGATARVQPGLATALDVGTLTIAGTGRVDLNDGGLVKRNSSGATAQTATRQITAALKAGLENGGNFDWLGPGVSSTEANADNAVAGSVLHGVGVIQNNLLAAGTADGTTADSTPGNTIYTTFKGRTVALNDTLVRYTYMGDADLSGNVDGTDYSLIDAGFGADLSGWLNGDFDYSGSIDGTDYALIDNAFGVQVGTLSEQFLARYDEHVATFGQSYVDALALVQAGFVPEPASIVFTLASLGMAARRCRGARRRRGK